MSTPTPPAETITALARRYRLELDTGKDDAPEWTMVPGVNAFTQKTDQTTQDVTDYESGGWARNAVTQLAWSVEVTIMHRCHPETGAFNASQEALRKASMAFGAASLVHVRWYDRDGRDEAYEGRALVQWEPDGSATDDVDSIKITLTGDGPLKPITNPTGDGGDGDPGGQSLRTIATVKKGAA